VRALARKEATSITIKPPPGKHKQSELWKQRRANIVNALIKTPFLKQRESCVSEKWTVPNFIDGALSPPNFSIRIITWQGPPAGDNSAPSNGWRGQ
jgi:hypothetical protein